MSVTSPSHILAAYVVGATQSVDPQTVVTAINEFIASRSWVCPDIWAVHQTREGNDGELGLNITLPEPYREPAGWYADVEAIVDFCVKLHVALGLNFTVCISDRPGITEDVIEIDSVDPDRGYLKQFLGVPPSQTGRPN